MWKTRKDVLSGCLDSLPPTAFDSQHLEDQVRLEIHIKKPNPPRPSECLTQHTVDATEIGIFPTLTSIL